MSYRISKELFEAVLPEIKGVDSIKVTKAFIDVKFIDTTYEMLGVNDFFFECLEFIHKKGYVFNFDTRGYSRVKRISNGDSKFWEDEEFNKQRIFDACQWVLDKTRRKNEK